MFADADWSEAAVLAPFGGGPWGDKVVPATSSRSRTPPAFPTRSASLTAPLPRARQGPRPRPEP